MNSVGIPDISLSKLPRPSIMEFGGVLYINEIDDRSDKGFPRVESSQSRRATILSSVLWNITLSNLKSPWTIVVS